MMAACEPIGLDAAERMLSYVRGVDDREVWVKLAFALQDEYGDAAFDAWDRWSQGSDTYKSRDARAVWKSCGKGSSSKKVTIGTLIAMAKEGGYRPSSTDNAAPNPAEIERRRIEREQRNEATRKQAEIDHAAAAKRAAGMLAAAKPAKDHAYLEAKGITGTMTYAKELNGELLIEIQQGNNKVVGLQRIFWDDSEKKFEKKFLSGTPMTGSYGAIGEFDQHKPVFIVEGYATGLSVHAATGAYVVIAFYCNNLDAVARKIRATMPKAEIIIAGDDDAFTAGNPGRTKGNAAATAIGARAVFPVWSGERGNGKDFNDLAQAEGLDAVAACFAANEPHPLDRPLDDPAAIYHPEQIDRKKHRETQEWVFHKAKGTAENLSRLVKAYGVRIRYNELSRDVEISVNGNLPSGDLARNVSLSLVEDLCRINEYPYTAAASHLDRLADMDAYNPAMEWVKSRQWDGEDRIRALYNCLTLADETKGEISWTLFRKWMLGAMAILCGKARKFEHVLVLVDQMGGIGKTRFFNTLSPKEYQADGVTLNPDDKDSVLQVASKWLVELGEIGATFGKSDIEILKAFLSRDTDELRPAYAKAANRYQRRTAFFGSVNSLQFLSDDTNNRRFWPIHVAGVNYQHTIDMQQVWAEALARIERGETWHLDQDENRAIGEHNEAFRSKDRVEEMIVQKYDPSATLCRYMTASEVLVEIGVMNPKQTDTRKASALLRKVFEHKTSRGLTVFHMPAMKIYRTAPSLVRAS